MTKETNIKTADLTVHELVNQLAAKTPTPGGGTVSPIVAALGASLGRMVVAFSAGKKKFAEYETLYEQTLGDLADLSEAALALADDDARAYQHLSELWKLDKKDPRRKREWDDAIDAAIAAPAGVIGVSVSILRRLSPLVGATNAMLASDLAIGADLAEAAARASAWSVRINLPMLNDGAKRDSLQEHIDQSLQHAETLRSEIEQRCGLK